ncbi:GPP34 family phosphoprotein [Actinomadura sp. DC4]|uniref:GOLPH3/VPS74 family protein n=1 Tax=Actinomadura sp. DC4 TaxID=3055069 RepID=UPI0025B1C2ED|nr:GPP34 family phosphoprotein [Actinomadura sp. DC4]MDN3351003.1 GPP34 family phosphoprotein [Actinomadura sp. DC4]
MSETLAEELLLLAHDIRGKCRIVPTAMDCGVTGALLSELGLAGHVTVEDSVLVATGDRPAGDPILDELLAGIVASSRTPREWVTRLRGSGLTERLLTRMVQDGRVEVDHHRNYGLFAETWYPVRDIVALWEAHQRVVVAATAPVAPDERTPALGALAEAAGLGKVLFATSGDWRALCERVREATAGDWAAEAVRRTIGAERRSASV